MIFKALLLTTSLTGITYVDVSISGCLAVPKGELAKCLSLKQGINKEGLKYKSAFDPDRDDYVISDTWAEIIGPCPPSPNDTPELSTPIFDYHKVMY